MQVSRASQKNVGRHCRALNTNVKRGLDGYPRHGDLKNLRLTGTPSEVHLFILREHAKTGRLSQLETLCCLDYRDINNDDNSVDSRMGARMLADILRVAPKLTRLELDCIEIDGTLFRFFDEGCSLTSLVVRGLYEVISPIDPLRWILLRSIKSIEIDFDEGIDCNILSELFTLLSLEHVTIHDLYFSNESDLVAEPCRWKTLVLIDPTWQALVKVHDLVARAHGMQLRVLSAKWEYDGGGLEVCSEFERAVRLFIDLSPGQPFAVSFYDPAPEPEVVDRLVNLLMPIFVEYGGIKLLFFAKMILSRFETLSLVLNCYEQMFYETTMPVDEWRVIKGHLGAILRAVDASGCGWGDNVVSAEVSVSFKDLLVTLPVADGGSRKVDSAVKALIWKTGPPPDHFISHLHGDGPLHRWRYEYDHDPVEGGGL